MNLPDLDALNSALESIKPHTTASGLSIRLDSYKMDGQQIEEAIAWFLDGGSVTKTRFHVWQLERGFLTMYVGGTLWAEVRRRIVAAKEKP